MHGFDQGGDVVAFCFGAGEAVLSGPGVPKKNKISVIFLTAWKLKESWASQAILVVSSDLIHHPTCPAKTPVYSIVTHHFSLSAVSSAPSPSGLFITPSTSPSMLCL